MGPETYKDILFYESLPICNVKVCLYNDVCYCTADHHNITPNTLECDKLNSYFKGNINELQ